MLGQDITLLNGGQGQIVEAGRVDVATAIPNGYGKQADIHRVAYLSDGLKIKGFLLKPSIIKENETLPAIIYNRPGIGDSHKIDDATLAYLSVLPANGYVVTATQYRGNDGSEGSESYLDKDIDDVLNMMALTRSLSYVDNDRLGMLGFSRGAAVTYQLLKRQVDIKAACVMGCATDFVDAYEKLPHYRPFLQAVFGGKPGKSKEEYTGRSPLYWPEKINVPLLLIQGTDDHHVPRGQVESLAAKLEELGKIHDMVIYPEGDHTLDKFQEDKERRIVEWFDRYVK